MSTTLRPLSNSQRELSLDVLRGFALAGVLFMFCVSDIGTAQGYENTVLDEIIAWPKWILVEGRMYAMLIVIFGIGFHVQLEKAKKQGVSLVPSFSRRLAGLLVIGVIHAILLSARDILIFYAIAGIVLLILRNASTRLLAVITFVLFIVWATPFVPKMIGGWAMQKANSLAQPNDYVDHVKYNWHFFKYYHQVYLIYVDMMFHFLLGFLIGRTGLLLKLKSNDKFRLKLLILSIIGTIIFLPLVYYWIDRFAYGVIPEISNTYLKYLFVTGVRASYQFETFFTITLYGTILVALTVYKERWMRPLAAFGQMALSNYLVQSLILVPYFLFFDKYNDMPPAIGFIVFLVVFAFQLVFSSWWLSNYKLGPFEWLLRSITYWSWQPIKKSKPIFQNA